MIVGASVVGDIVVATVAAGDGVAVVMLNDAVGLLVGSIVGAAMTIGVGTAVLVAVEFRRPDGAMVVVVAVPGVGLVVAVAGAGTIVGTGAVAGGS
jgi:hypothetical protein